MYPIDIYISATNNQIDIITMSMFKRLRLIGTNPYIAHKYITHILKHATSHLTHSSFLALASVE